MAPSDHDMLADRLRAAARADVPSFDESLHRRIMAAVDVSTRDAVYSRKRAWRPRILAAAALVVLAVLIGLSAMRPHGLDGDQSGRAHYQVAKQHDDVLEANGGMDLARLALRATIGDDALIAETVAVASAWQAMEEDATAMLALADRFALGVALAVD